MLTAPSDDAFDPPPLPAKRRRLNPTTTNDDDSSSGYSTSSKARCSKKSKKPSVADRQLKEKKTPKLPAKRRIHIPRAQQDLEGMEASQVIDIVSSSPNRIRGAIWKKPRRSSSTSSAQPVACVKRTSAFTPPTSTSEDESSGAVIKPVRGSNDEKPATLTTANANSFPLREAWDDDDDDDYAFQPILDIDHNRSTTDSKIMHTGRNVQVEGPGPAAVGNSFSVDIDQELANLPSDAFESSSSASSPVRPNNFISISSQSNRSSVGRTNLVAPQNGLRQTTLFGTTAPQARPPSQVNKRYNYTVAARTEPPTHHKLEIEALKTWVYPTNLGTIRDYQFNIVARALFHNLLVALPTGLGKTFIAATVMLNWYRWTKNTQIVFVAPTKPLVSQQVDACFKIAGIPHSVTTMMTGGVAKPIREDEWATKRVFFITPHIMVNDIKSGLCDPKRLVLLVVDEAHRATGNYSYVELVKLIRRYNQSFRILALTATPGANIEAVQEVINGLDIARVEIRTEASIDIRQYVHSRKIEEIILDNSEEMEQIMQLFSEAVQPVLNKLHSQNAYWSRDPMQLTAYGLTQARQRWCASDAGRSANMGVKGMVNRIFAILASLAHGVDLLKFHGIGPFYHNMLSFRGGGDGKYEKEIRESEPFRKMMTRLQFWIANPTFVGHPKLEYLQGVILKHFVAAGEGAAAIAEHTTSTTRVMIFAHFRDSAEEITRVLARNSPMIRPHVFVGQAASKSSEGMDQKKQLDIIQKFKAGTFNTLVATSIGEEGLDIGEVDLIICYDSSASPIRMLQRMGRTGRKRAGSIVLLLMRGKEANSFRQAKDSYESMQRLIADGGRFDFHDDRSSRILPHDIQPKVDKRIVHIPVENTQVGLPEPNNRKRRTMSTKRAPKKFNMPDGVLTGFTRASRLGHSDRDDSGEIRPKARTKRSKPADHLISIPSLADVVLTSAQDRELRKSYAQAHLNSDAHEVAPPDLTQHPEHQRRVAPVSRVVHGRATRHVVAMLDSMHTTSDHRVAVYKRVASTLSPTALCAASASVVTDAPAAPAPAAKSRARGPSAPRAPRKKAATTAARRPKSNAVRPYSIASPVDEQDDDGLSAAEGQPSSPPPTDPRMAFASGGISLGSDTSGSDAGDAPDSSLADFVADDDEDVGVASSSSAATAAAALAVPRRVGRQSSPADGGRRQAGGRGRGRASGLPGLFSDDEDDDDEDADDDELPALSQIVRGETAVGAVLDDSNAGTKVTKRRKAVIRDSSEEE